MGFLCGLAQNRSPVSHRLFGDDSLVVAARHARIEVDFLVSRNHTIVHQCASFSYGGNRCFLSPREGAGVIPPEQDSLRWQPGVSGSGMDGPRELLRRQPGITTELVDLARSRLQMQ